VREFFTARQAAVPAIALRVHASRSVSTVAMRPTADFVSPTPDPSAVRQASKLSRLFWEDFEVGDVFAAPWGRTITDAHLVAFAGVNGDFQHLHVDETYAAGTEFEGRIAHGNLIAAQGLGMQVYTQVFHHAIALLEERHLYKAPVRVADTIFSVMTVTGSRPTKHCDRGVVFFKNDITNQRSELVCESAYVMMLRRHPTQ
jgi:3-hydroxybutyryl-CoA dehydratase